MTFTRHPDPADKYRPLHMLYCEATGMKRAWTAMTPFKWRAWAEMFDGTDLKLVVGWLKNEIKAGRRFAVSLRFDHLIEDCEKFADDLAEARGAWERKGKVSGKEKDPSREEILRATGRPSEPNGKPAKTAAQILAESEALRKFREMGDAL